MKSYLVILFSFAVLYLNAQCVQGNCNEGDGIYQFKSGALFEGTFVKNQPSNGSYFYTNGDIYVGQFSKNKRHGIGKYYHTDGRYFEGTYSNDKKEKGKILYNDNSWYNGEFYGDKRHGTGTYFNINGHKKKGIWESNKYLGSDYKNISNTYVVIVGIGKYKHIGTLNYTVADAQSFEKLVNAGKFGFIQKENVITLYDHEATASNITKKSKLLFSKAQAKDKIIFFFSGHGASGLLATVDMKSVDQGLNHETLKSIFSLSKAKTKLIIADACNSGTILSSPKIRNKSFSTDIQLEDQVMIFMSSRENEKSLEVPTLGHGLFTYHLIHALSEAGDANNDKMITIDEMYYYVRNNTVSEAQKRNKKQCPLLRGKFDRNLVISYL
jgi:hypothetical protein